MMVWVTSKVAVEVTLASCLEGADSARMWLLPLVESDVIDEGALVFRFEGASGARKPFFFAVILLGVPCNV